MYVVGFLSMVGLGLVGVGLRSTWGWFRVHL